MSRKTSQNDHFGREPAESGHLFSPAVYVTLKQTHCKGGQNNYGFKLVAAAVDRFKGNSRASLYFQIW